MPLTSKVCVTVLPVAGSVAHLKIIPLKSPSLLAPISENGLRRKKLELKPAGSQSCLCTEELNADCVHTSSLKVAVMSFLFDFFYPTLYMYCMYLWSCFNLIPDVKFCVIMYMLDFGKKFKNP